jgi:hypothetical protein
VELEHKIADELEMLSDLKKQIREVIEAVPDTDERMVLKYRYIHNYTWEQIGNELFADPHHCLPLARLRPAACPDAGAPD